MTRLAFRRAILASTLMLLISATTRIVAQYATPPPAPPVVTGSDPEPQIDTVQMILILFHLL